MGNTALMGAAFKGYTDMLQFLLENGADIQAVNQQQSTALIFAATYADAKTVRLLLENGADPWARDQESKTALDHAMARGEMAVKAVLEEYVQSP